GRASWKPREVGGQRSGVRGNTKTIYQKYTRTLSPAKCHERIDLLSWSLTSGLYSLHSRGLASAARANSGHTCDGKFGVAADAKRRDGYSATKQRRVWASRMSGFASSIGPSASGWMSPGAWAAVS